ncbi:MAG: biliverdin-producing heme oxygenase [Thermogemmata sp.]|nr:biliverdin-producing heme oxygenase [Thermogemmata sp.]
MEILAELRRATSQLHSLIEELPVSCAMRAGLIDRMTYIRLLVDLYHIHSVYETQLSTHPEVAIVWPDAPSRAAAIRQDLSVFAADPGPTPRWTSAWSASIEELEHPAAWAGVGYVIEGSRFGSQLLVKSLATALNVPMAPGYGINYYLDIGNDVASYWKKVTLALTKLDSCHQARQAIVNAAIRTFETCLERFKKACECSSESCMNS